MIGAMSVSLLAVSAAIASVLYNWRSNGAGTKTSITSRKLVVSNEAYQFGTIDFDPYRDDNKYDPDEYPLAHLSLVIDGFPVGVDETEYPDRYKRANISASVIGDRVSIDTAARYSRDTRLLILDNAATALRTNAPFLRSDFGCNGTVEAAYASNGYLHADVDPGRQVPEPSSRGMAAFAPSDQINRFQPPKARLNFLVGIVLVSGRFLGKPRTENRRRSSAFPPGNSLVRAWVSRSLSVFRLGSGWIAYMRMHERCRGVPGNTNALA